MPLLEVEAGLPLAAELSEEQAAWRQSCPAATRLAAGLSEEQAAWQLWRGTVPVEKVLPAVQEG